MRCAISWSIVVAIFAPCTLLSGRVPESHVDGTIACTEFWLALFLRFENEVTRCLYFSSGDRISLNLKFAPEPLGIQRSIAAPCAAFDWIAPYELWKYPPRS